MTPKPLNNGVIIRKGGVNQPPTSPKPTGLVGTTNPKAVREGEKMTIVGNAKRGGTRIEPIRRHYDPILQKTKIYRLNQLLDKIRRLAHQRENDEIIRLINEELNG